MQDLSTAPRADARSRRDRRAAALADPTWRLCQQGVDRKGVFATEARRLGLPFIDPDTWPADPGIDCPFALRSLLRLGVLPRDRAPDGTITLACATPLDIDLPAMERLLGPVHLAQIDPWALQDEIARHHGPVLVRAAEASVPAPESCRNMHRITPAVGIALAAAAAIVATALIFAPVALLSAAIAVALVSMVAAQVVKVAAMALGRSTPPPPPPPVAPEILPRITLLIPLFKERDIAGALLQRLQALRYPRARLEVLLILEEDDSQTRATIAETDLPPWMRVIMVPEGTVRTKPRAMNYALNFASGEIIGIYDAEDAPDPDQLLHMAARFAADPSVDCLQGVLDYYNPRANWLSRCFTVEYSVWFRLLLPGLVRMGFVIPLGGTTVFIRRHVLESVRGWDAHNVTEDADLGIRLARHGHRTEVVATVTGEEANNSAWPWVRQRSRWLKGYIVTYLVHMRRPAQLWRDLGAWRFLGIQLVFLTAILQFTLAPVLWSFWALPLGLGHPFADLVGPSLMAWVFGGFIAAEAVALIASWVALHRGRHKGLGLWVPTMIAYYPLGTMAMYKALWEMLRNPYYWDKTMHGRSAPDSAAPAAPPAE